MKNKTIMVSFLIEPNGDGYLASVPGIQGAFAEGDSIEEALFNCVDVIKMILDYRKERNELVNFNYIPITKNTRITVSFPIALKRYV
ncbi:MAG: type II toxin-antitoxin system HicB family antitoxin [Brevinematia bacterium]